MSKMKACKIFIIIQVFLALMLSQTLPIAAIEYAVGTLPSGYEPDTLSPEDEPDTLSPEEEWGTSPSEYESDTLSPEEEWGTSPSEYESNTLSTTKNEVTQFTSPSVEYSQSPNTANKRFVTFRAHVDPRANAYTIFIQYINMDTTIVNGLYLFKANDYMEIVEIEPGNYQITGGNVENDFLFKYSIEPVTFSVGELSNFIVDFDVGDPNAEPEPTVVTEKESEDITAVLATEENSTSNNNPGISVDVHQVESSTAVNVVGNPKTFSRIAYFFIGFFLLGFIVFFGFVIYVKKKDS